MKECKTCNEMKELTDFYKKEKWYYNSCKPCTREGNRESYSKNKVSVKATQKKWREENKGHRKEYRKKNNKRINETQKVYLKEYMKKPESRKKHDARMKLNASFKYGRLKKRNSCEICITSPTETHHEDYDKPLQYIELCVGCHKFLHRQYKANNIIINA